MATVRNFHWTETDEPHASRRKLIFAKHPEIETLFGREPKTFFIVLAILISQIIVAYFMQSASWGVLLIVAYVFGGTVNHSLQLAAHEISHNMCFASVEANRWCGYLCNLATGVPSFIAFQKYHTEHHLYQGTDGVDTDVPTMAEVNFFTNPALKVLWLFMQPIFYAGRPMIVSPKSPNQYDLINWACVLTFDWAILSLIGGKALVYLIAGTLLGLGLHPCAGHFIAEHYEFTKNQETYSYYGICNRLNFNVGYHVEHHDFPRIPWSNLPKVRKIAPEFYDSLPHYTSYVKVMWNYIMDTSIGPFSRIKRKRAEGNSASASKATDNLLLVHAQQTAAKGFADQAYCAPKPEKQV